MWKLSVLPVVALAGWCCLGTAPGQETAAGIIFSKSRAFRIPFSAGSSEPTLKQLQLFFSLDQGKTWQPAAVVAPREAAFRFAAERDGYYWFTVQTTDAQGRLFPPALEGAAPSLKVVVDTKPPDVSVNPLPPRGNEIGVAWVVRDENLDLALPDALRLEYLPAGATSWLAQNVNPVVSQHYWNPQSAGPIKVRLRARDRAGNFEEATTLVAPALGSFSAIPPADNIERPEAHGGGESERKLVNSKRISLNFDLKEVGPSGVSAIELWYTMDGRSWNKHPTRFADEPNQKAITFDVADEGVYGISLVAKSGVGLGERPPQVGDRPQVWIEVDVTKPQVQLHNVLVGNGADKGKLSISWSARDKNLTAAPITLSYGEQSEGPWKPFAPHLKNNGQFVWQMPDNVPYQFHVKVEAADRANNIGEAVTENLVKVDLSTPKVLIRTVEPANR
jgi:hypothetical protein